MKIKKLLNEAWDKSLELNSKLLSSRRGYSTGFTWVFGLVTLFGLGILYIVFNQVFNAHLIPVITDMVDASTLIEAADKLKIIANIEKYMVFFNIMPFVLFFVVILYMIVAAIRKEGESEYV